MAPSYQSGVGTAVGLGVGVPTACVGIALAIGFLTPVVAGLVAAATSGVALGWIPVDVFNRIDSSFASILLICICIAIVLVGPGALSIDARLFGRREIVIPAPE